MTKTDYLRQQAEAWACQEAERDELAARIGVTRPQLDALLRKSVEHPGIRWVV